ncbi:hypothetical protein [Microbacterium sp. A93]|uniref:hypothetical protein n=1 Tax=Microbacterium sp. A93 TaxID=3450716 RepID=UPI003F42D216
MNENKSDDRNEKQPAPSGPPPALIDLTGRAALTPGPLTKPSPTIRPLTRRPRWVVPLVLALVIVALAGGAVALYVAL